MDLQKKKPIRFNPTLPTVHSLSSALLISNGFIRNMRTYTKGDKVVKFDGYRWFLNGEEVQFIEQVIKKEK